MGVILVVDDEESFLQIVQIVLQRGGYQSLVANNGSDALQLAVAHQPALIILDDMMPGLSGGDVCIELKKNPATRQIPVLMHSAGTRVKDAAYIEKIGADGVLLKPSLPVDMLAAVSQFLQTTKV
jgi:CheY-like chemotaxis protein